MSRGEASSVAFMFAALLLFVLYLAWWHAGELELLGRRVDELERRPAPAPRRKKAAAAS